MAKKRLIVTLRKGYALRVTRGAIRQEKVVYVIVVGRKLKYSYGRSPVVYIGTTKKGVGRIAHSAAYLAPDVFDIHGVKEFGVRVITCKGRSGIKSWTKLERALLLGFREKYGDVPKCNSQGAKIREKDEFEYFRRSRIRQILTDLEEAYRKR